MNKKLMCITAIILVLSLLLMSTPSNRAFAGAAPVTPMPQKSGIADGDWQWTAASIHGTEVSVNLASAPAPVWLQLLTSGLKIDGPAKICHPFKGGQYKWIGEIRQWVAGKWVKLDTVNDWEPDKEGQFMSCAMAPAAGTYALFGYYTGPAVKTSSCQYSTSDWNAGIYGQDVGEVFVISFFAYVPNLPAGSMVNYQVLSVTQPGSLNVAMSGSGTVYPTDHLRAGHADFIDYPMSFNGNFTQVILRISSQGCSKDILIPVDIG